jgi:hypothetical protein
LHMIISPITLEILHPWGQIARICLWRAIPGRTWIMESKFRASKFETCFAKLQVQKHGQRKYPMWVHRTCAHERYI